MTILADDKQSVPVTVTLRAETMMLLMVAAVQMRSLDADEVQRISDAMSAALKI